ncbi:MAG: hypothetical protein LBJ94_01910 [Puniceicoccales bacterium]|nr:hypothetical protein [Puniceicoccales bacterium]
MMLLACGTCGFAARDCFSETTLIGSKVVPALKFIGNRVSGYASSIASAAMAHPYAAIGCAVGCILLGATIFGMRKFIFPQARIPGEIQELAKKVEPSHLQRLTRLESNAHRNARFNSLHRLDQPDSAPSSASENEEQEVSISPMQPPVFGGASLDNARFHGNMDHIPRAVITQSPSLSSLPQLIDQQSAESSTRR